MTGHLIRHIEVTASTNDDVAVLARDGAPEGTWLRADTQLGGRGRQGRNWVSPPGNLYASTLVRPMAGDPPSHTLAMVAAVALDQLLRAYVDPTRVMIKWPNDLLVDGAKISGILLEAVGDAVVVGIGVNLAHHPEGLDRRTTSLAAAAGASADPGDFLDDLAESFAHWLRRWRSERLPVILQQWRSGAHPPGTPLSVGLPDGTKVDGAFYGLDDDGTLRLQLADGSIHHVHAGDVFLL